MKKVLFVANWYPSRVNTTRGIFIKKHAETISNFAQLIVIHPEGDPKLNKFFQAETTNEKGIRLVTMYYKVWGDSFIGRLFNKISLITAITLLMGREIFKSDFDLVHVNVLSDAICLVVGIFCKLFSLRYIITEHWSGYVELDGTFNALTGIQKYLYRRFFKNAAAVSVVSDYLGKSIKKSLELPLLKYSVIPNIVERHKFKNGLKIFPGNNVKMIHVSLLEDRHKNISGIISALAEVVSQKKNIEFHIIGDGRDRELLESKASNLGLLNKHVFFHGAIQNEDLGVYFSAADFSIINSRFETFCIVAAESLIYGTPVLSTKCGGPEDFIDASNGLLIESGSEEALVKGILWMIKNSNSFDKNGLIKYVKPKFSRESISKLFKVLYENVFKERI